MSFEPLPAIETECTMFASPDGDDSASGDFAAPFHTAQRLVAMLRPGDVGCLRAGTYVEDVQIDDTKSGLVLRSANGEQAIVRGSMLVVGNDVTIRGLDLTGGVACLTIGRRDLSQPPTERVHVEANRIYGCTMDGIYVTNATDTRLSGNTIFGASTNGIELYPSAQRSIVDRNVADGNGTNVIIGGNEGEATSDSLVHHNVLSNATAGYNVDSYFLAAPIGTNNVVRDNCVWTTNMAYAPEQGGIEPPPGRMGFEAAPGDNFVLDPAYVDPGAMNFTPTNETCAALLLP